QGAVSARVEKMYQARMSGEIACITLKGYFCQTANLLTQSGPTVHVPSSLRDQKCKSAKIIPSSPGFELL
nr:hypothetical protein [Tanacetum cinerariifolium]